MAPRFHMGQLMTVFMTPVPVNETDMLVYFCHSSAREAEAGKSRVQDQPLLQRRFGTNVEYNDQFQII